jgi:pyridoxal phosphate enzyme (YggS family)
MIVDNLKKVIEEIKNGNNLGEEIILVGATKMVDADTINLATKNGLKIVAENRVQEFREKTDLIKDADQHFIGHLQTNKVKYLVGKVSLIQSVDSIHLAEEIDKCASKKGVVQDFLIEVNVGGELSKSGFDFDNAFVNVKEIADTFTNVRVLGLMAMLPHTEDQQLLINLCEKMRSLYDALISKGYNLQYLSMGMSADYKIL